MRIICVLGDTTDPLFYREILQEVEEKIEDVEVVSDQGSSGSGSSPRKRGSKASHD